MSLFGRALAGAGRGAADIASKYISAEIADNRAKLLAELQHQNAVRLDQYQLSPERQSLVQAAEGGLVSAREKARLGADTARETDETYQSARRGNKRADLDIETDAVVGREGRLNDVYADREGKVGKVRADNELDLYSKKIPLEVGRETALNAPLIARSSGVAEAAARAQAKYREPKETVGSKLREIEAAIGRPLTETEKLSATGMLKRDPELDTQTVVEEVTEPATGKVTTTTRREVRRPGAAGSGKGPEADPIKAAMDAARAGKSGATAPIPASPIAGRPYLQVPTMKLNEMLRGKVSSRERMDIMEEIDRRKRSDIQ